MNGEGRTLHRQVEAEDAGSRLDKWLTTHLDTTRSQVKRCIEERWVKVNDETVKAGYTLHAGDKVVVRIPEPVSLEAEPQDIPLNVVYEDSDLVVVNKPAGMVVHPAPGHQGGTLVNALLAHCSDLSGIGGRIRPGIVHRLDKDTTGLIVAAKNDRSHRWLADQIRNRTMIRVYVALVSGRLNDDKGVIEGNIGRHPKDRKRMAVVDEGRPARTYYQVKERLARWTLVECTLDTGRTHQIRVHMASIHHPVVGDPLYGSSAGGLHAPHQMLHAQQLRFIHPHGESMQFCVDTPPSFQAVLEKAQSSP